MFKIIKKVIAFSLKNRLFIFFATFVLIILGGIAYKNIPIEAFPDVTNTQITIITQWAGRSAEEVEKFVTVPLETALTSVQKKSNLRTTSAFGLSYIRIIFDDDVDDAFARQQVLSRLGGADLPEAVKPDVQPPYGPTGEIYRYTLKSATRSIRDLTTYKTGCWTGNLKVYPVWQM